MMNLWKTRISIPAVTCLLLFAGVAVMGRRIEGPDGIEVDTRGGGVVDEGAVVVVENGTEEAVILDCPYHLDEKDLKGIRIAWYHERFDSPVYQWIPNDEPQAIWILKDRVDLTYEASPEPLQRYRALRILNPTTELNGRYQCHVSSFNADVKYQQNLIVFKQPSGVNVHVEEVEEGLLSVNCSVDDIFPQPLLHLYLKSQSKPRVKLEGGTLITSSSDQTYSLDLSNTVEEETLDGATEFECHAAIPDTDITIANSTIYQPKITFTTSPVVGRGSVITPQQQPLLLLTVVSSAIWWLNN